MARRFEGAVTTPADGGEVPDSSVLFALFRHRPWFLWEAPDADAASGAAPEPA